MERRQPENATDVAFCNYFYGGLIKPLKTELQAYRDESALWGHPEMMPAKL